MNTEALTRHFTPDQIKQRKGPWSKDLNRHIMLDYVEAHTVIARLNEAFEYRWDFRVVSHEVTDSEVLVLGELVADGIKKRQFGGKEREEKVPLSFTAKIAASDALKKCATLFGVALHLYDDDAPRAPVGDGAGGQVPKRTPTEKDVREQQRPHRLVLIDSGKPMTDPQARALTNLVKSQPEEKRVEMAEFLDTNPTVEAASERIKSVQADLKKRDAADGETSDENLRDEK